MFYVYELIDPRDGRPFYVGKGKGSRVHQHARDAANGAPGPRLDRIREITAAGLTLEHRIVRRFKDEQAAYDFEAERIVSIGFDNLTNLVPGGGLAGENHGHSAAEDARLARSLANIARRTANFTWFPAFIRLGDTLYPLGACHVLSMTLVHAKLVSRRGAEWVAKYSGNSKGYAFG